MTKFEVSKKISKNGANYFLVNKLDEKEEYFLNAFLKPSQKLFDSVEEGDEVELADDRAKNIKWSY
jgi:hypothetical protein